VSLPFTRLNDLARPPARAHDSDAGYDLHAAEDALIGPGERASVGTGIALAVPAGHAALVLPRSGLAARHGIGLVNAPGLIDPEFRGEVRVLLLNTDMNDAFEISVGDRIAQLLIVRHEALELSEQLSLEATPRGEGGFGSTGR